MKYQKGLFIFHRDLRTIDNTTLLEAVKLCHKVYVCFIFTEEQASSANTYRSIPAVSFMIECLKSLSEYTKGELAFFYGKSESSVLQNLLGNFKVDCLFYNRDYTPYAIERERVTKEICGDYSVDVISLADLYLFEPGSIVTQSANVGSSSSPNVYKKFTPFYDSVVMKTVDLPKRTTIGSFTTFPKGLGQRSLTSIQNELIPMGQKVERIVLGGRKEGIKVLNRSLQTQSKYEETRDLFSKETSHLSAYIKFGVLSIREIYHAFEKKYGRRNEFIRQLLWRDFYAHLLFAHPHSIKGEHFGGIKWTTSKKWYKMWCDGETGFPIVDAAMRELNSTGYMHNRGRMIVATFLTKTLGLSWKLGEAYFARCLTDYDIASNNGNWQNISSTGVYAQPYFRDMNPWIQSKRFDAQCEYIKKWVPELGSLEPKVIHHWYRYYDSHKGIYCPPMVDYDTQKKLVLDKYESDMKK